MTQRAREEGRTKGVSDLAGGPSKTRGRLQEGLRNCVKILRAVFFKGYSVAKIKFEGESESMHVGRTL